MSGYEEEHNIQKSNASASQTRQRRPDLSSFFSALDLVDTHGTAGRPHNNANAEASPGDIAAVTRQLANAYQIMLGETEGVATDGEPFEAIENPLLERMIQSLLADANDPPKELKGVSQSFLDELERIPKKNLKPDDQCPICRAAFLDDQYPLVVRLSCNPGHLFDLECIGPWLRAQSTCPLDRKDLVRRKNPPKPTPADEEDGEWDEMYA